MLERMRAAALDIMVVAIAWEMRSEGQNRLWRYLIGSEDGDIALHFLKTLQRESTSQSAHKALSGAFAQWFRSEKRVNDCDHETLNYMDLIIQESGGKDTFGDTRLKALDLEVISCLPDKTAYLLGQGNEVLCDPLYSGLCNEINQAHYTQIINDLGSICVQGIRFRNADLAAKIFPNGEFTQED
jgi:hypothetical protein